ncbi:MAG: polymer-forming cytoskeletal protein, partial [Actinomycetota bacterium]
GEVTIIGQGAKIEGTLVSAGSLRVDGQVKGTISAECDVMLSPQSNVEADIRANNVAIAGKFKGDLTVKGTAELARGGRIEGNITSKTLVIQEGGVFSGQSIMDGGAAASAPASASANASQAAAQSSAAPAGSPGQPTGDKPAAHQAQPAKS